MHEKAYRHIKIVIKGEEVSILVLLLLLHSPDYFGVLKMTAIITFNHLICPR